MGGGGDSYLDYVSYVLKLSLPPIVFESDLCYFCLVNAGYESGSWIGVLRDQNTYILTTVELTLALWLRGHILYSFCNCFYILLLTNDTVGF